MNQIHLLPLTDEVTFCDLLVLHTDEKIIFACDFRMKDVESWTLKEWGWEIEVDGVKIINIDHHANHPAFFKRISSANLALMYLQRKGLAEDGTALIVIHHTDCDSVLTAGLLSGMIKYDEKFGIAAIAADHTGEENVIADLLQTLEVHRDLVISFGALDSVLAGAPSQVTLAALCKREANRAQAEQMVTEGQIHTLGKVSWIALEQDQRIGGEILLNLVPEAWVLLTFVTMKNGGYETKARLGNGAPKGTNLYSLDFESLIPNFGGRWNAGSNKRRGGSLMKPEEILARVAANITDKV